MMSRTNIALQAIALPRNSPMFGLWWPFPFQHHPQLATIATAPAHAYARDDHFHSNIAPMTALACHLTMSMGHMS